MLRVILGVRGVEGRPDMHTDIMYKTNNLLKIESIYKLSLFKLLRQLLDGHLPDMYGYLLDPYASPRYYETRNGPFLHPAITSEVERRSLPHQLITLYDKLPVEYFNRNGSKAAKDFKTYLLNTQ